MLVDKLVENGRCVEFLGQKGLICVRIGALRPDLAVLADDELAREAFVEHVGVVVYVVKADDERLFALTEDYIGPDDFTEDIFREVAELVYEQHAQGEINPAQIISRFTDEEQQREAAALFHARLHPMETRQEREKALKETILRIKKHSMDVRSRNLDPTDLAGLQKIVEDKKQLAILQKMHISLD